MGRILTDEAIHDPEPTDVDSHDVVLDWRLEQAIIHGVSIRAAEEFAKGDGDLGQLRSLIEHGCPPDVAARTA